jgi:serine protease
VVSAGNSTDDVSKYRPANCKGVISVAALAAKNKLSSYSNYGNTSIAAAGGDGRSDGSQSILSAIWNSKEGFNLIDGGSYGGKSGTSMAAPSVSAAIADIISLMKAYNNPYTPEIIEEIIKNSAQSDFQKYSTDLSKSITSKRLDVESAVKYTINNYLKINN